MNLRNITLFLLITILTLLFYSTGDAGGFKKEYKMTVNVGPNFYWGMGAIKFSDLVKEKTNGQINIKPYFGSTLLKGAQLKSHQMVAKGVIDCAYESTINSSPVIPEMNIFSLPFFINSFEILDKIENGQTGAAIFEAMEKKGLKPLAWGENGFRQITTNNKIVRSPYDLKDMRVRVVGSPIFIDIFRHLGADPVNMNWGDAVTAFQQGVVDCQENPVGILVPVQIWQYHKHVTMWNYLADPLIIYWGKRQWKKLPQDIKKAIMQAAVDSTRFEKALCRSGLDGEKSHNILQNEFNYNMKVPDPVKFMKNKGMTVSFLTDDEIKIFAQATRAIYDKWVPKIGKEVYQNAKTDMGK